MAAIVVLDCETNGLHRDRLPWEIAMLVSTGTRRWETVWFFIDVIDVENSDPMALKVGKFHERFPWGEDPIPLSDVGSFLPNGDLLSAEAAASLIHAVTRKATLIGANTAFDAGAMDNLLALVGLSPEWKYRLACVQNYTAAQSNPVRLPSSLHDTARSVGIDPGGFEAHTALGDALLTHAIAEKIGLTRIGETA